MTEQQLETDKSVPHGLAGNFQAPFSGALKEDIIRQALAKLPEAKDELREAWLAIDAARNSGLAPTFDDGPLDDAMRQGVWHPELQVKMPTASGLPGSKGQTVMWKHSKAETNNAGEPPIPTNFTEAARSVKSLIGVYEQGFAAQNTSRQVGEDRIGDNPTNETQHFSLHEKVEVFELDPERPQQIPRATYDDVHGTGSSSSAQCNASVAPWILEARRSFQTAAQKFETEPSSGEDDFYISHAAGGKEKSSKEAKAEEKLETHDFKKISGTHHEDHLRSRSQHGNDDVPEAAASTAKRDENP